MKSKATAADLFFLLRSKT